MTCLSMCHQFASSAERFAALLALELACFVMYCSAMSIEVGFLVKCESANATHIRSFLNLVCQYYQ